MEQIKNCSTCGNSEFFNLRWKCIRVFSDCDLEVWSGTICGPELKQWTPRPEKKSIYTKLKEWWNAKFNSESKSS